MALKPGFLGRAGGRGNKEGEGFKGRREMNEKKKDENQDVMDALALLHQWKLDLLRSGGKLPGSVRAA